LKKFAAVGSTPQTAPPAGFEGDCALHKAPAECPSRKKCKNSRRQPLQIDRGGRQICLDFHVGEAAPDGACKSVPCLGFAVKALRAPAMTLIEPKVLCGPALTTAASAEQSGIMIADDNSFIDASFGQAIGLERTSRTRSTRTSTWSLGTSCRSDPVMNS
jgi:hypothetical protein